MAYEEEDNELGGSTSQFSSGLAPNPYMPFYDPLYSARVTPAPESTIPSLSVQGAQPQQIMRPAPVNIPSPRRGEGDEGGNALTSPPQQQDNQLTGNLGSLNQLLQMKGLMDLAQPGGALATLPTTAGPGGSGSGGKGGSGSPAGVSETNAGPYQAAVNAAADANGIDRKLFTAQLYHESGFDKSISSPAGARGIGQFMPATARDMGMRVDDQVDERTDPIKNINAAAKYYAGLKKQFGGSDQLALAAYNWGPGWTQKWLEGKATMPKETRDYIRTLTGRDVNSPADIPTAQATPKAAEVASKGEFAIPPGGTKPAPGFGEQAKAGQMSPHGGPYVSSGGKLYATDENGNIVGKPVAEIGKGLTFDPNKTEDKSMTSKEKTEKPAATPPLGNDQGTPNLGGGITRPQLRPEDAPTAVPEQPAPAAPAPAATPAGAPEIGQTPFGQSPDLQKLWKFMLIRSLFPQLQFRNVGYDPWAVHRFGMHGGY